MTRRAVAAILVLATAVAGCAIRGRDDVDFGTNPLLPIISFEDRDLGGGLVAPIPVDWTTADPAFPRVFRPPANGALDRDVTLWWVDTACGGPCTARSATEWEEVVAAAEFAQFDDPGAFAEIRRREAAPGFALVEAENNFGVVAMNLARWEDGASEYLACRAAVPADQADLLTVFAAECQEVALSGGG